ncbi:MAG TPA: Ig-like domain repeat protein [Actinomycetota bacterium]|nr:Ig-like domain repeat protein [Actinomycetota bacterium]
MAAGLAVGLAAIDAAPAAAAITTPPASSTQTGDLYAFEDRGATHNSLCSEGRGRIELYSPSNVLIAQQFKGADRASGPFSVVFDTAGLASGTYRLRSVTQDRPVSFVSCSDSSQVTRSDFTFTLSNGSTIRNAGATTGTTGESPTVSARLTRPGLHGRWWATGSPSTINEGATPSASRIHPTVDMTNYSIPAGGSNGRYENYNAVLTGYIVPAYSQAYTINITTDDGVRVWVNNTQIINSWVSQGPTEYNGTTPVLQAGSLVPIRIEHFQGGGGQRLRLRWSSASQGLEVIPASRLRNDNGIAGKPVTFELKDDDDIVYATAFATTNSSGVASAALALSAAPGSYDLHATYDGDAVYTGSTSSVPFTVTKRPVQVTNLTANASTLWDENQDVSFRLTDGLSGAPLSGQDVSVSLGSSAETLATDSEGEVSTTFHLSDTPGSYQLSASFAGNGTYLSGATSTPFTISRRPTALTYAGDTEGFWNENAAVSATLADALRGTPISGRSIDFQIGSQSGSATSDDDGRAATSILLADDAGARVTSAYFGGDAFYTGTSDARDFTIKHRPTTLAYVGDRVGLWNDSVTLSAKVTDDRLGDQGVAGLTVDFTLGSATTSAVTDAHGVASASVHLTDTPGAFTVTASFSGDGRYVASGESADFDINKRPTTVTYDGALNGRHNESATLSATLTDGSSGDAVAGKSVGFTLGSFSGSDDTDAAGAASVVAPMDQDAGTYTVSAAFDGDDYYVAASDNATFTIGWEHTFTDDDGAGSVFINTSNKQFGFARADGYYSGVIDDPEMKILSVPSGIDPPSAPEPPDVPELPEIPQVPECLDDPLGGDPVCPADYLPPLPSAASSATASTNECVDDPLGGDPICPPPAPDAPCDPNAPDGCIPETPEPPTAPCDPNDPASCLPAAPTLCDLPGAYECHERFVLISYHSDELTLAGFFDLDTGQFIAVGRVGTEPFLLRNVIVPAPPCNPEDPASCLPDVPETPEPPCDANDPEGCLPPAPEPPCDPNSPEGCVPETPEVPEPPSAPQIPECLENPAGDPVCP